MGLKMGLILLVLGVLLLHGLLHCATATGKHYSFVVKETPYRRLCRGKTIMTVNGQFPGPTLYVHKGDKIIVDVYNHARCNVTIHWHGVKQPRNPWSDGPEYITQCPIKPGSKFTYTVIFSNEEGTVWWHAHSSWTRATVHGAIVVYPKIGTTYPFPTPYREVTLVLAEWWKSDVNAVLQQALRTGGSPNISDAFTINGQPGDLYACSKPGTFRVQVEQGKTYLLRMVNAAMNDILFFAIAGHQLTVVGIDASYTKPLTRDYIVLGPGQSTDALLVANQTINNYYIAARAYSTGLGVDFDNTTTTAILQYAGNDTTSSSPSLPYLPYYNDTSALLSYIRSLRSLATDDHPIHVPPTIQTQIITTLSVNTFQCHTGSNDTCQGPNVTRLAASMNNISFVNPSLDILEAYYRRINGVYGTNFPSMPPLIFNFTADYLPLVWQTPRLDTEVKVLRYNSSVQLIFQGTNLVAGEDHPMHLHGFSFYVVGVGLGNYDATTDPSGFNLVDPPRRNTITIPKNGWVAIRFWADNPGVWYIHCHLERHLTWGMDSVFLVRNGHGSEERLLPPPQNMPPC